MIGKEDRRNKEVHRDIAPVCDRSEQIKEINSMLKIKLKIERKNAEECRRKPVDSTPWLEMLNKVVPMSSTKRYTKITNIGDGSYSIVHKVKDEEGNIFAMKRFTIKDTGSEITLTTLREIKALLSFNHPNIITFTEVCQHPKWKNELSVVTECGVIDLLELMRAQKQPFHTKYIKSFLYQALSAVCYMHQKHYMHRDIKLSNFILMENGDLKLVDFGLTRGKDELEEEEDPNYTPTVATLWYRAPELLLGDTNYTTAVDLWSIGCLHAELLRSKELFPGRSDLHQLCTIFEILGTPTEQSWPGYSQLPVCSSMEFTVHPPQDLRLLFPGASETEFQLLSKFLLFDPKHRITASEALQHPFFTELPLAEKFTPQLSIL